MNATDRVLAKSPAPGQVRGELLTEHLAAITAVAQVLRERVGTIAAMPARFWQRVLLACLFHDAGKIPEGFQRILGPGPAPPWGQRHEIYSLGFVEHVLAHLDTEERRWIGLGVVTHHRPLTGGTHSIRRQHAFLSHSPAAIAEAFGPVDEHAATVLADWLAHRAGTPAPGPLDSAALAAGVHRLLDDVITHWAEESPDDDAALQAVLLQGAVTLADHVASAHAPLLTEHPLTPDYPHRLTTGKGRELFAHQRDAHHTSGHLLLRAPTGTGKTEASLLWALTQITELRAATGGQPRLFYLLPYLASINAITDRLSTDLADPGLERIGVIHSKAADFHLTRASASTEDADSLDRASRAVAKAGASRLFRELLRVGTPYRLMRGALAGTAHAATLLDSANSVFIFDELHAYDTRRLGLILAMMGLWTRLGGRIGVVSATLPRTLDTLIEDSIKAKLNPVAPPADQPWPTRHSLHLDQHHLMSRSTIATITRRLREGHSVLVVANNVAHAHQLYEDLGPTARALHGEDGALLLHARFRNRDRARIEKRILGRYASGTPREPGLVVATQVVEVSLDLDFDLLHTSAAVLEALIQRFGRINRLGLLTIPAPVTVHRPEYTTRQGESYADGVYPAEPARMAWDILARHDGAVLDEKLFTAWLDKIYESPWGDQWRSETEKVRDAFHDGFLSFDPPFADRTELAEEFDRMFDGSQAVLDGDLDAYTAALQAGIDAGDRRAGQLLASEYLIPLPHHARGARYGFDPHLGLTVIDAAEGNGYSAHTGLEPVQRNGRPSYRPEENP